MREYFDLELKALNDKLIEMGALVEGAIKNEKNNRFKSSVTEIY